MFLPPDVVAVLLAGALLGGFGSLLVLRMARQFREGWLFLCAAFGGLHALVATLNTLRPSFPVALGIVAIPTLQLLAFGFLWGGLRQLRGRASVVEIMLAVPGIWLLACLVPGGVEAAWISTMILLMLTVSLLGASAFEARAVHGEQGLRSSLALGWMLGVQAAFTIFVSFRVVVSDAPSPAAILEPFGLAVFVSAGSLLILAMAQEHLRRTDASLVSATVLSAADEMTARLAHEINTPLAIIGLAAENAADVLEDDDREARHYAIERLRLIAETVHRARIVVKNTAPLAHGAGVPPSADPIALSLVLANAVSLTQDSLRPHGITLDLVLPPEALKVAVAAAPLEQIFSNLILSAKDAICKSGRCDGVIRIQAARNGDSVEVEIEDNGGRIPDAVLPRVFEPFFTADGAGQGMRLGIVLEHGTVLTLCGTLRGRNGADGVCFTLVLPYAA